MDSPKQEHTCECLLFASLDPVAFYLVVSLCFASNQSFCGIVVAGSRSFVALEKKRKYDAALDELNLPTITIRDDFNLMHVTLEFLIELVNFG